MGADRFNKINNIIMNRTFQHLTTRELLYRKCIDLFAPFYASNKEKSTIIVPGYTLLKNLTSLSSGTSALIGIFMKNGTSTKVFIKKYVFEVKGLRYASLMNELSILRLLQKYELMNLPRFNFIIPALKHIATKKAEITIICAYKKGTKLLDYEPDVKIETLKKIFSAMRHINNVIKNDIHILPHRYTSVMAGTFIYFWIKMSYKEKNNIKMNITLFVEFYRNYIKTRTVKNSYGLIHRDLHSRNILLDNKDIIITDWEGAVVTDAFYDLAMVARLYINELTTESRITLLKSQLQSESDVRRFLFLTVFYSVQTLGVDNKNDKSYQDTEQYIKELTTIILPALLKPYV